MKTDEQIINNVKDKIRKMCEPYAGFYTYGLNLLGVNEKESEFWYYYSDENCIVARNFENDNFRVIRDVYTLQQAKELKNKK